ncbi:PREDICTED: putative uncharacterized protein FLJ37770 [Cyphomyrmex costatus]|uniref:putative uncharacterized protein FLJ37770 n=1 Tax=Cyphomyrmex costatus TaxID=456900 RepID=UPI0008523B27|nr:PREDICTED: putative uncharacterized protein FLJ37770 [Cyphomyrmex costatus]
MTMMTIRKTATQIQAEFQEVHGTSTPSLPTISFWVNEFKRGRTNTDDEPRSGRPKTATNEEMVNNVLNIVMSDRRLKLREIVEMRNPREFFVDMWTKHGFTITHPKQNNNQNNGLHLVNRSRRKPS